MTRDVVIVGGGIAGLAAAWRLRHRDVLLLEASDRLGGRMRSDPCGDYWLNYGAHLFPAPGSLVDGMARDCGLETVPVTGSMMGLAVGDTLLNTGRVETYPFRLPLSVRDRVAFARAGVKVQRAVARYHRAGRPYDFDDDRTFGELLGPLPPAVEDIFSCAAHRATAELDELSAGCGVGLFALVWGGKGSLIARNLLGGTGRLPEALGRELGERARTGSPVDALEPDGDELVVRPPARRSAPGTSSSPPRRRTPRRSSGPWRSARATRSRSSPTARSSASRCRRARRPRCPTTTSTRWRRPAGSSTCSPTRPTRSVPVRAAPAAA